jgi:hypothetical protein
VSFIETEAEESFDTAEAASWGAEAEVSSEAEELESEPIDALFELDGEGITLDEARNGYLRQRDYTRKTQELAEQRRQLQHAEVLQAALQRDPQATLKALADAYGVEFGSRNPAPAAPTPTTVEDDWGWSDTPTAEPQSANDPRLDELVQWRQQQEIAAAQAQIKNELAELEGQYGEFDQSEVLRFALERNFPDVTAAFKAMHFDKVQSELSRRQEDAKRVQAKRDAQVVSPAGVRSGASTPNAPKGGMTIREAFLAAKKELGG